MTIAEPVKITRMVAGVFEQLQIPYYVVGSLASSFHGIPRATADADLIADIKTKHIRQLLQKLKKEFYVDEERIQKAVHDHSSFNVIHLVTMFKIDVFILKSDPLSKAEMARRERYQVTEEKVVRVPVMITNKMGSELRTLGYTQEQIDKMTPEEAWNYLNVPSA